MNNFDLKPHNYLQQYYNTCYKSIATIENEKFNSFIEAMIRTLNLDSRIYIFGNGGSGATASHFVCDINKGVSYEKDKKFKIICLNDNMSILTAYANDICYDNIFVEQLKNFIVSKDLIIGISGSGNSKNVIKAISYANEKNVETFALTGFSGGKLAKIAKNAIIVNSNDMQIIEDIHMMLLHCAMQILKNIDK